MFSTLFKIYLKLFKSIPSLFKSFQICWSLFKYFQYFQICSNRLKSLQVICNIGLFNSVIQVRMDQGLHRGAFCQFTFRWIYYCHNSKSTGKKTGKRHLCAVSRLVFRYTGLKWLDLQILLLTVLDVTPSITFTILPSTFEFI